MTAVEELETTNDAVSSTPKEEEEEEACIPDPAAFLPFEKHQDAVAVLWGLGYKDAAVKAPFAPDELMDQIKELLKDEGIAVMDMTTTIPNTSQAAYKALTISGFNASAVCKKDMNAAFVIMRTQSNTPSFLMGHHWSMSQALGKDVADTHIRKAPTPAAFVIFRDRQFYLPSSVFKSNVNVASRLVARELTMKDSFFACCICNQTFVQSNATACVCVSEIGMAPCEHMFHRSCVERHITETGKYSCPECDSIV